MGDDPRRNWQEAYEAGIKRRDSFRTLSFEEVPALGTPSDPVPDRVGYPGQFPYTRGVHATGYRGRLWTMRQFAGFASVADTNERFRHLLAEGQGGLSVAFDMPTLMGLDADDARSLGEVGHCGVAVSSADDMVGLFDQIPLSDVSVSMTINGPAEVLFGFLLVAAEEQGVDWARLRGTLQNDILKEYIAQKEWIFPPEPHLRLIVEACLRRGLAVDDFVPRLSFFFDAHIDFFEEIGKFRAARRIWARWMRDRYGAASERSLKLRFHTQTAGVSLTAQQPESNIVRTAVEAMAAVLGGTQSLHTNAMDEVFALPTAKNAEIALRTQQIIAEETGVAETIDPLGGSWFVEEMTDRIEAKAEEMFATIDRMGGGSMLDGVLHGIAEGWFQSALADSAYEFEKALNSGERVIVGVNKYVKDDEPSLDILRISAEVEAGQRAGLARLRGGRDGEAVNDALEALRVGAAGDANLMELIIAAARVRATLGEIVNAMKDVFGGYREPPRV